MDNHKLIPIRHVGVDSGRLLIVDPAHLRGDELQTLLQQLDVEQPLPSNVPAQQLNYSRGQAGLGVVLVAGWGCRHNRSINQLTLANAAHRQ